MAAILALSAAGTAATSCAGHVLDRTAAGEGGAAATHPRMTTSTLPVVTVTSYVGPTSSSSSGVGGADAGWAALPALDEVAGCQGDYMVRPADWPKPVWQTCGEGCLVANALDYPTQIAAESYQSGAVGAGSELYYRTESGDSTYRYNVLRRLSDDEALFVTRTLQRDGCYSALGKDQAPFVFEFYGTDGVHDWVGYYDAASQAMKFPIHPVTVAGIEVSWFSWGGSWGALSASSAVQVLTSPNDALTTVSPHASYIFPAHARAGLVAWVDWTTFPSTISSWTAAAGARTLFQAPADVAGFGLSDRVLAFVDVTGGRTIDGYYQSAHVDWTPFSANPADAAITQGPDISGTVESVVVTATGGDWIAVRSWPGSAQPNDMGIVVVKMSTKQAWRIHPVPGTYLDVAAVNERELLAYEILLGANPNSFARWRRFDLSQIDGLGVAVTPSDPLADGGMR